MFQNLRKGSRIYILYRNEPRVEEAEIDSILNPATQYNANQYSMISSVVDIRLKVRNDFINLKEVPANSSDVHLDNNSIMISESKENIISEIESIKADSSARIIPAEIEKHRDIVERCSVILENLKPEIKREVKRDKEIEELKANFGNLSNEIAEIKSLLLSKNPKPNKS